MSRMDDERLIEIVRDYEFLYNLKHPKYMDSVKKDLAWKEIAAQLKQPAAACKQRWQSLRDAYRRALNKRKGKSGPPGSIIKQWKYETEMNFVVPYFIERKRHDSLESTSDEEPVDIDNTVEGHTVDSNVSDKPISDTDLDVGDVSASASNSSNPNSKKRKLINNTRAEMIKAVETQPVYARLMEDQNRLLPQREQWEHDALDRFFLTISDTVKKFPPYTQALAKKKIFTIVSEMELQQLAPTTFTFNPSSSAAPPGPANPGNCNNQTLQTPKTEVYFD